MTKADLPPELMALIHAIDACELEAEALVADLSEEEVNWQERAGETWSVAQCLDHLTKMNTFYLRDFVTRVEQAKQQGRGRFTGLKSTAGGRWFVQQQEPPPKRRVKAPTAAVVPESSLRREGLVEAYRRSHDLYRSLVHSAAHVDVNRVKGPNPFFKFIPMRVSTILQIVPAHDRRHLWQAANVKRALRGA